MRLHSILRVLLTITIPAFSVILPTPSNVALSIPNHLLLPRKGSGGGSSSSGGHSSGGSSKGGSSTANQSPKGGGGGASAAAVLEINGWVYVTGLVVGGVVIGL